MLPCYADCKGLKRGAVLELPDYRCRPSRPGGARRSVADIQKPVRQGAMLILKLAAWSLLTVAAASATPAISVREGDRWPFKPVGYWFAGPQVHYVQVTAKNHIKTGQDRASFKKLRTFLENVSVISPPFYVVLKVSDKADPAVQRRVYRIFDQATLCRQGYCVEIARWEAYWRRKGLAAPR